MRARTPRSCYRAHQTPSHPKRTRTRRRPLRNVGFQGAHRRARGTMRRAMTRAGRRKASTMTTRSTTRLRVRCFRPHPAAAWRPSGRERRATLRSAKMVATMTNATCRSTAVVTGSLRRVAGAGAQPRRPRGRATATRTAAARPHAVTPKTSQPARGRDSRPRLEGLASRRSRFRLFTRCVKCMRGLRCPCLA